jgi:hypothetical protein
MTAMASSTIRRVKDFGSIAIVDFGPSASVLALSLLGGSWLLGL